MTAALAMLVVLTAGAPQPSAQELEQRVAAAPGDLALRQALIRAYFSEDAPKGKPARIPHVLWLIEHAPEAEFAGTPLASVDRILEPQAYEQARVLWLHHVKTRGTETAVLAHAADFFRWHEAPVAEDLLRRGASLEPESPYWRRQLGQLHKRQAARGDVGAARSSLEEFEAAMSRTRGDTQRYYALGDLAEAALVAGETAKARAYATELLTMAESLPHDWNYGNAIDDGHRVLGRLALKDGDRAGARAHLLAAGATPGSPQLNASGPELTLAKDLLAAGEREAVVQYLASCERFWADRAPLLRQWAAAIRAGQTPELDPYATRAPQP
jgi:hypothetical protein